MRKRIYQLAISSISGRYALGSPDGPDITSGQRLSIYIDGRWISGIVEHASQTYSVEGNGPTRGYYFIADDGTVCGLCAGMRVATLLWQ